MHIVKKNTKLYSTSANYPVIFDLTEILLPQVSKVLALCSQTKIIIDHVSVGACRLSRLRTKIVHVKLYRAWHGQLVWIYRPN
jgi:hypothetical protein